MAHNSALAFFQRKTDSLQTHIRAQPVTVGLHLSCSVQLQTCSCADPLFEKNKPNKNPNKQIQAVLGRHSPAPARTPGALTLCSSHCSPSETWGTLFSRADNSAGWCYWNIIQLHLLLTHLLLMNYSATFSFRGIQTGTEEQSKRQGLPLKKGWCGTVPVPLPLHGETCCFYMPLVKCKT